MHPPDAPEFPTELVNLPMIKRSISDIQAARTRGEEVDDFTVASLLMIGVIK